MMEIQIQMMDDHPTDRLLNQAGFVEEDLQLPKILVIFEGEDGIRMMLQIQSIEQKLEEMDIE